MAGNELVLAKKLAVVGWLYREGLISEDEYERIKRLIMDEHGVCSLVA